jgi:hypothetical protein
MTSHKDKIINEIVTSEKVFVGNLEKIFEVDLSSLK